LSTEFLGENPDAIQMQIPEKDLSLPTVACARCQSLAVYSTSEGEGNDSKLTCAACHALLKLDIATE
jgi:formylmethanofuran dehydrogenase subunit E